MTEELLQLDKELFLFLNNLGTPTWDGFWLFITNKFSAFPLYVLLLFLAYRILGLKKVVLLLVVGAAMVGITNELTDFFKYGVQRLRPCHDPTVNELMRLVKSSCGGKFGYFSAHASNSFAIAALFSSVLRTKYKYIGILLMVWACLMAYSRIYIGVHFPLDVLTGAFIGLLFGWISVKLYILAIDKFKL